MREQFLPTIPFHIFNVIYFKDNKINNFLDFINYCKVMR